MGTPDGNTGDKFENRSIEEIVDLFFPTLKKEEDGEKINTGMWTLTPLMKIVGRKVMEKRGIEARTLWMDQLCRERSKFMELLHKKIYEDIRSTSDEEENPNVLQQVEDGEFDARVLPLAKTRMLITEMQRIHRKLIRIAGEIVNNER